MMVKRIPLFVTPGGNAASARELFKFGWDTVKIAAYFNITEAQALKRITIERCSHKRLPSPYGARR